MNESGGSFRGRLSSAVRGMPEGGRDPGPRPGWDRGRACGLLLGLLALSTVAACGESAGPAVEPGVPLSLARDRARRISDLSYDLGFRIPDSVSAPLTGRVTLRFTLDGADRPLALDFDASPEAVRAVRVGVPSAAAADEALAAGRAPEQADGSEGSGREAAFELIDGHIVLPAAELREGVNQIRIEFTAGDGPLNRNPDFLYTLFVPDRAHRAFPCFDQPDLKARYTLELRVPAGWTALSNGAELSVAAGSRTAPISGSAEGAVGGSTFRFARTEPLSTYQFAFAAGRFRIEEAERDGRRMRMFHRETDSAKVARNREAIFDLHAKALAWLEDYTGIPYPFGKFDFVLVPSFQYGGMEHPGAIYYRAAGLLLDESATQNQKLGRASVISHETTHMWFGDLVTMRWFDDVWMKEVFANFMAAKIVNPSFPEIDHDLRFLLAHYPAAYAVDRTDGANPIRQELDNLKDAGTLYGAIIYQKAPIVMKHLELLVGQDAFRDGLREYLRAHAYGNASWPDLIDLLDRRSDEDLRGWSHAWVEEPGRPTVEVEELPEAGGAARKAGTGASDGGAPEAGASDGGVSRGAASGAGRVLRIALRERDPRGRGLVWTQPLTVLVVERAPDGGEVWQSFPLRLAGDTTLSVTLGAGGEAVILANGAGVGYGRFELTPGSREELLAHLPEVDAPVPRAVAWLSLWDEMLEGGVAPERIVDLAMRDLAVERDELIVSQVLGDLGTAYWRFLPPERRTALAPRLEALLWSRLEAAEAASLKSSFFRGYEAVALSGEAVERLARVWRGERKIPGLPLSERDYTRLALQLAVREAPGWRGILAGQSVRIRNPDRRARFEFVRPALDAAPEVREAFFRSLKDLANRAHEPWVLEALSYLHHPLRAESSLRDIRPSLEWLEEIQRTGDIFFPKRWLDATLGGHSSPEAAGIVRDFLDGHPDYPPRLRAKILQSADLLFRAARARSAGP